MSATFESVAHSRLCRTLVQQVTSDHWDVLSRAEWLSWVAIAEREGVAPLLYWQFKQQGWPSNTPDEARTRLTRAFYATSAQNMLLLAELDRVISALNRDDIAVVAVKGAALVYQLYPNIGLRPMGDIDLLVPKLDIDRAARALENMEYERTVVQSERLNRSIGTQLGFTAKSGSDLRVEVHWSLIAGALDRRAPDMNWFWSRTKSFQRADARESRALLTLTPTAHLLYVAAHAMLEHGLSGVRLLWLYDVHLMLSHWASQVAWDELFDRARAFGWADALITTLRMTVSHFGTELPEAIAAQLSRDSRANSPTVSKAVSARSKLKLAEHGQRLAGLNLQARMWYTGAMIFPSPRYIRAHYGQMKHGWWPLGYVIHWITIMRSVAP